MKQKIYYRKIFEKSWEIENIQYGHALIFIVHFKDFIRNREIITRIIYAWRILSHNKIDPKLFEAN